jgi:hypothetical protein
MTINENSDNNLNMDNIKIETVNDIFKLPIFFQTKKSQLKENIIQDLELIKTIDTDASYCIPILDTTFQPTNCLAKKILEQIPTYYSYDTNYINDTQELLKSYKSCLSTEEENKCLIEKPNYDEIVRLWSDIKLDTGFREKYHYMDWSYFLHLNESELFLQIMSFYNMTSPIISLFVPIFILIVPFFIIKARGLPLSLKEYVDILKILASNHAIGKLFTQFNKVKLDQKLYLLISAGFYLFSIYQNILTCIRFHHNMKNIHIYLEKIKNYLDYTILSMKNFSYITTTLKNNTYTEFNKETEKHILILEDYRDKLSKVSNFQLSFRKIAEIGKILKYFYQLNYNEQFNTSFLYSFGFNGYIDNLEGLIDNIQKDKLHFAKFININSSKKNKKKNNILKKSYYAALINKEHIKNDVNLDKAMIITGPNASGKTTVLKSALINVILSQQFGCGFYEEAILKPYKFIHCYLNIPDTSGRDSLFQAEARRCKEIIDVIKNNDDEEDTHFCVFDEIYSGTNPEEAVISALAFMEYLVKIKNVQCIMTTHFIKVCKKLNKNKNVKNYHMHVNVITNNDFSYTYKMKEGISEVHGGIKVLNDMNYPSEIINNTKQIKKNKTNI